MTTNNVLVDMKNITKAFPGVLANDKVNLTVKAGEIHALLGENGAGKSTLMSVLTGLYRCDQGELRVHGQKTNFTSPREAIREGIGMVHQHFKLVSSFTVAENIAMGLNQDVLINLNQIEKKLAAFSQDYGLQIDPKAKIWQLSIGEQQRVEIVKLLYRGADILILDEPTAVLTPQESNDLYTILRKMADEGKGVIVITHKMQEVADHADVVTVMRGGKSVATLTKDNFDENQLARLMVGKQIELVQNSEEGRIGETLLELQNVKAVGDGGSLALKEISLKIRAGEILGIAGVAGNGQKELAEVMAGQRKAESGKIVVNGTDFTNLHPLEYIKAGLAYIPEDRCGTGLVPNLDAKENIFLKHYCDPDFCRGPFVLWRKIKEYTKKLIQEFDVKTAGLNIPVKSMSGGNLQKLLLAREISTDPKLLIAVYPVRGLDIGAIQAVRSLLLEARRQGKGVLLISEELEELFLLSDRLLVLHEGEVMGVRAVNDTEITEVGLMMAGKMVNHQCA